MADAIKVEVKDAKKEFFKLRARFQKLQRVIIASALFEASDPIVATAQANAPVLKEPKKGRQAGQLRGRIGPTLRKLKGGALAVAIGPVRLTKNDKQFPFWGLFQEKGWFLTGHTPKERRNLTIRQARALGFKSKKASRTRIRFISGSHFLKRAGESQFRNAEQIFAARVIHGFEEIQSAGEAAGLV